jgi:hypothetical protein
MISAESNPKQRQGGVVRIPVTLRAYLCYPRSSRLPHMRGHAGANFFFPSLPILGPPRHRVGSTHTNFRFESSPCRTRKDDARSRILTNHAPFPSGADTFQDPHASSPSHLAHAPF